MPIRQPPLVLRQALAHRMVVAQLAVWALPAAVAVYVIVHHNHSMIPLIVIAAIVAVLFDALMQVRLTRGKRQLALHYPRVELWEPPPEDDDGGAPLALLQANLIEDVPVKTEQGSLSRHRAQSYELMLTPGVFIAGVGVLAHRAGPNGKYGIRMSLCDHNMRRLASDAGEWGAFFRYAIVRPGSYILELQCMAGQQLDFVLMYQHQPTELPRMEMPHQTGQAVGVHATPVPPPPPPPPPPPVPRQPIQGGR